MRRDKNRYVEEIIKVDGKDLTKYLSDEGYDVEWYDISYDSGRNAKGYMHYNPIAQKYKIILRTKSLTSEELVDFFSTIKNLKQLSVYFFCPYTGTFKTVNCYRGDRKASMLFDFDGFGKLYDSVEQSLIEL